MQAKSLIYARRLEGDLDLGLEPARIDPRGDRRWSRMDTPGGLIPGGVEQGILEVSTSPNYRIGTRRIIDERVYRYGQVGSARQLRAAYGCYGMVDYAETGLVAANSAALTFSVTCNSVAAVTANEYAEGTLSVQSGAGYGTSYKIKSNTADLTGAATFTVTLYDPIVVLLTDGVDRVTLFHSPWYDLRSMMQEVLDGVLTNLRKTSVIGVPNRFVPLSNYCWLQTNGPCMVVPAGGNEGVADDERAMAFEEDGCVARIRYDVVGAERKQYAGFVLPVTTGGAIPGLLQIYLQIGT